MYVWHMGVAYGCGIWVWHMGVACRVWHLRVHVILQASTSGRLRGASSRPTFSCSSTTPRTSTTTTLSGSPWLGWCDLRSESLLEHHPTSCHPLLLSILSPGSTRDAARHQPDRRALAAAADLSDAARSRTLTCSERTTLRDAAQGVERERRW